MGPRRPAAFPSTPRKIGIVGLSLLALWMVMPGTALAGAVRDMRILDRCDPDSFNAAFGDGTCSARNGGVPLESFLRRLNPHDGGHNAWGFSPDDVRLKGGQSLRLDNRGGETHTFTEVVAFGGGFVPELNAVLPPGTPPAVPIGDLRFIAAGQAMDLSALSVGEHRFECLIHPWMQTTVAQRSD